MLPIGLQGCNMTNKTNNGDAKIQATDVDSHAFSAIHFMAQNRRKREAIARHYAKKNGSLPYVLDHANLPALQHRSGDCNFLFWVYALFVTYGNASAIVDAPEIRRRADEIHALAERLFFSDVDREKDFLIFFVKTHFKIQRLARSIVDLAGLDEAPLPKMDEAVNIWEFATHPDVEKALRDI